MANGAAELIWQLWNAGEVINDLPFDLKPRTRAQGYAVQAQFAGMSKRPLFGWKVAATSKAGQEHIGVSGPIAGRILAERAFEDGDELVFGANRLRVAEPEFAVRFGKALQPRRIEYTMEEILDAVATLHPSIEVPDSRFDNFATVGEAQLIADNACAHEFVLGPATDTDWRAIDLSQHKASAEVVGGDVHDGIGSNVLGDPREALLWLVKEVMNLGYTIEAGQVVTTGNCAEPLDIEPGNAVIVDFGDVGQVSISFDW